MDNKLISIELDNQDSVPKVIYKGKEIEGGKVKVKFNWETDKCEKKPVNFYIEYAEKDRENIPVVRTISSNDEYMSQEEFNERMAEISLSQQMIELRLDDLTKRFEERESGDGIE